LAGNRRVSVDIRLVYGSPEAPMTSDAQHEKFVACCKRAPKPLSDLQIERLIAAINTIEGTEDASSIVTLTIAL
jgi:hypothetical protein